VDHWKQIFADAKIRICHRYRRIYSKIGTLPGFESSDQFMDFTNNCGTSEFLGYINQF